MKSLELIGRRVNNGVSIKCNMNTNALIYNKESLTNEIRVGFSITEGIILLNNITKNDNVIPEREDEDTFVVLPYVFTIDQIILNDIKDGTMNNDKVSMVLITMIGNCIRNNPSIYSVEIQHLVGL